MGSETDLRPDLDHADYEQEFEAFVRHFSGRPPTLAVGRFGGWGDPGVSDLDGILVVEDGALADAVAEARRWIALNDRRAYLFWHPPLVLSRTLLPHAAYLHSLEGLHWVRPPPEPLGTAPQASRRYLDVVWATYLLAIAARIRFQRLHPGTRAALLILKNLHMAAHRLPPRDDVGPKSLERDRALRVRCLDAARRGGGARMAEAVTGEVAAAADQVARRLDGWVEHCDEEWTPARRHAVRVRRDVRVVRDAPSGVTSDAPIVIRAHPTVFDAMFGPWDRPYRGSGAGAEYRDRVRAAAAVHRREKAPFPFVRPFDWPAHERPLKGWLRRLYWAAGRG